MSDTPDSGSELLPCPFCQFDMDDWAGMYEGSFAQGDDDFAIQCSSCECVGPFVKTMQGAFKAWNTRPTANAELDNDAMAIALTEFAGVVAYGEGLPTIAQAKLFMERNPILISALTTAPEPIDETAEAAILWQIIDDIDTAFDAYKPEMGGFENYVNRKVKERFAVFSSDGYKLHRPGDSGIPTATEPQDRVKTIEALLAAIPNDYCPQCGDGSGAIPISDGYGGCEAQQCQWCYEREALQQQES